MWEAYVGRSQFKGNLHKKSETLSEKKKPRRPEGVAEVVE
jgi:hypothetical protein